MALKKIKLPNNTTVDINDARNVVIGDGADNIVTLTNAEYQALTTKDPNTVYIVTDVNPGGGGGGGGDGTVTSVAMTVPTGLSVSGSPITTSGTLAVSLASGYEIPRLETDAGYGLIVVNGLYDAPNAQPYALPGSDYAQDASQGTIVLADDSGVVHKTGRETIAGNKTFSGYSNFQSADFSGDIDLIDVTLYNEAATGFDWIQDGNGDSVQDALDEKQKAITISTSEPTSSDGNNGDIWIVI